MIQGRAYGQPEPAGRPPQHRRPAVSKAGARSFPPASVAWRRHRPRWSPRDAHPSPRPDLPRRPVRPAGRCRRNRVPVRPTGGDGHRVAGPWRLWHRNVVLEMEWSSVESSLAMERAPAVETYLTTKPQRMPKPRHPSRQELCTYVHSFCDIPSVVRSRPHPRDITGGSIIQTGVSSRWQPFLKSATDS